MPSEKIYYGIVIFLCAVSMLLSPFFYMNLAGSKAKRRQKSRQWRVIALSNIVMLAALVWIWLVWF